MSEPSMSTRDDEKSEEQDLEVGKLNACLSELFNGPTKNLESAFGILISMLKDQATEHEKLKAEHASFVQEISDHRKKLASEQWERQKEHSEEQGKLEAAHLELRSSHEKALKDIEQTRQKIKVMAYNFNGCDEDTPEQTPTKGDGGDDESTDSTERLRPVVTQLMQQSDLTAADDEEVRAEKHEQTRDDKLPQEAEVNTNSDDSEVSELKQSQTSGDQTNGQNITEEGEEGETDLSNQDSPSEQSPVDIAPATEKNNDTPTGDKSSRRASMNLAKFKLDVHQTLAVRLERLENARDDLEKELQDMKSLNGELEQRLQQQPESREIQDSASAQELQAVLSRIRVLEDFLKGFGVIEKQLGMEESVNNDEAGRNESTDSSRSESDVSGTDEVVVRENANSDTAESSPEEPAKEFVDSEYQTAESKEDSPDGSEHFIGLLSVLRAREARTEQSLGALSKQVETLNDQLSNRVRRSSIQGYFSKLVSDLPSVDAKDGGPTDEVVSLISSELDTLREKIHELGESLGEKVSKSTLDVELGMLAETLGGDSGDGAANATENDGGTLLKAFKTSLDEELDHLKKEKVDRSYLSSEINESETKLSQAMEGKFSKHQEELAESIQILQDDVSKCRAYMDMLERKSFVDKDSVKEDIILDNENIDLDARIKEATDAVKTSLQDDLTARLEGLKAVEGEVENLTSRLAEKPDQEQINSMLLDLEDALTQRLGSDRSLQVIFDNMKSELKQRMTRAEVLSLVRNLLDEAKRGIENTKDSLMVGRIPYRCLGCNQVFPSGVNRRIAPKINHRALPSSSGALSPGKTSYSRNESYRPAGSRGRPGALRPLQLSHKPGRRPRTTGAVRLPARPPANGTTRSNRSR